MEKERIGIDPLPLIIFIIIAIAVFKCGRSWQGHMKESQNDPRVQERIKQEREDLNNRLLDRHFEEDARRKR